MSRPFLRLSKSAKVRECAFLGFIYDQSFEVTGQEMERSKMRVSHYAVSFPLVKSNRGFILIGFSYFWDFADFSRSQAADLKV